MKVICQSCGQVLPKTIITCPNCGGKMFVAQNGSDTSQPVQNEVMPQSNQPMQYNVPPAGQLASQNSQPITSQTAQAVSPSAQIETHPQMPYQGYVPPVAPPLPVHPVQSSPIVSQEAVIQPIEPALPPVYRKPLKPAYQMRYSGLIRRGFALLFDMILLGILASLAWQQLRPLIRANFNLTFNEVSLSIAGAVVYLLYVALFTSFSRQATIGKMLVGLWVYDMHGQRIGFWHGFIREILKVVLLPFAFLLWFTARKQTLADLIARTVVLYDPT